MNNNKVQICVLCIGNAKKKKNKTERYTQFITEYNLLQHFVYVICMPMQLPYEEQSEKEQKEKKEENDEKSCLKYTNRNWQGVGRL